MARHDRSPRGAGLVRFLLVVALGVGGAVALGSVAMSRWGDGGAGAPPAAVRELELTVPDGSGPGRCMVVSPQALANADLAFDATVVSARGDVVVLDVNRWFFGGDADRVRLESAAPRRSPLTLHGQPDFRPGQRWLVSATSGRVNLCGFTVPWTAERSEVYEAAAG